MSNLIFDRNVPGMTETLAGCTVGIAGCGGLGSNAAAMLVRAGIGRLILADYDRVEPSNLNRQLYFQEDIGQEKVQALANRLRSINPDLIITTIQKKLTPADLANDFHDADLLLECFDAAEEKKWLIEHWARKFPDRPLICASGLAGLGLHGSITMQKTGNIYFCGDFQTQASIGLCSARVILVSAMQTHTAIELLVRGKLS